MKLLPNEKMIIETDEKELVLTSHRVRYNAKSTNNAEFMSIMLNEVASCGIVKKTKPLLLALAIIIALIGLYVGAKESQTAAIVFILIAFFFGVGYFLTIRKMLEIASAGSSILLNVSKMSMNQIIEFVDELEGAKNAHRHNNT
jgi:EamA domain-containing membrane protein RarD